MNCYNNNKIFLTGGSGFIGSQVVNELRRIGFEVYGLTTKKDFPDNGVHWINGNLFDTKQIQTILSEIKPSYLMNFAWCANGDYLTSALNYQFRDAGLELLKNFKKYGGQRAVYAGTCFEYKFQDTPLKETSPLNPQTIYASCKNELYHSAAEYAQKKRNFLWLGTYFLCVWEK